MSGEKIIKKTLSYPSQQNSNKFSEKICGITEFHSTSSLVVVVVINITIWWKLSQSFVAANAFILFFIDDFSQDSVM